MYAWKWNKEDHKHQWNDLGYCKICNRKKPVFRNV